MNKITTLEHWHEEYNREEFAGKLSTPSFGVTRSTATYGYFEHYDSRPRMRIVLSNECFGDDTLFAATLLHEMIHQYQHEVLRRRCNHDAVFCSIARRLERKYNVPVR